MVKSIQKKDDPKYRETQDRVSLAQTCFYHIPSSWVFDTPNSNAVKLKKYPTVFQKKLRCGIELAITQDGFFNFDFESYGPASSVKIPGFRYKLGEKGQVPAEHTKAEAKAQDHAYRRCVLMNCFLGCFNSAESVVEKRGTPLSQFTTPQNYLKGELNLAHNPIHAHFYINAAKIDRGTIIKRDTLEYAVEQFDRIVSDLGQECVDVLHIIYQAHYLYGSFDFENALLLAWLASERLVNQIYENYINDSKKMVTYRGTERAFIDGPRNKKLNDGRTFSAAVMLEFLSFSQVIPDELFFDLEKVRKARNDWVHRLKPTKGTESVALQAAKTLFEHVYGEKLQICISYGVSY